MKSATHPSAIRIQHLLKTAGLTGQVVEFEQPTRTSAEAAEAIGCAVAEIAKTVVFRGKTSGQAILVVASGDNRVCERKVALWAGEKLGRADADFVREQTGYVIGGVSPLGFSTPVRLVLDTDLQGFGRIWAAAGTPFSVFPLSPAELQKLTGAEWLDIRQSDPF